MKKRNIAIVAGGDSSEYVVSVKSASNVFEAIDTGKYTPWMVQMRGGTWNIMQNDEILAPVNKEDFSFTLQGETIKFDYAYIIIHGTPGEDGILQGYFELLNIPYSTCDVQSSALTFNKYFCNNYLRNFGVKMANSVRLLRGDLYEPETILENLGLPMFVKPNAGGSSFGVTKVKEASELQEAINKAFDESDEVLIEEFIEGKEFTCGLVKIGAKKLVFPVTEVIPKNEFFNYESKYVAGMADEITPARISDELTLEVQTISSRIYDWCNCNGIVRMDFILRDDTFYFLEVNTIPGMTATSFIPQQVKAMGLNLTDLISEIIEDSFQNEYESPEQ